ncbi:hypothetical protein D3C75_1348950 [compost metagenome]
MEAPPLPSGDPAGNDETSGNGGLREDPDSGDTQNVPAEENADSGKAENGTP